MTNIVRYDAARLRQARDLQTPQLRLSEDGTSIELTLHDNTGNVVCMLEYVLREKAPEDFDLGRLCALWDILRGGSTTAS
jgi:hypothetical protein